MLSIQCSLLLIDGDPKASQIEIHHLKDIYTKAELITLVQKQVSAALKQHTTQQQSNKQSNISLGENKQSKNKSKSGDTETKKKSHITKQAWKAQPPDHGVPEMKQASGKTWHWCVTCGFS